MLSYLVRAKVDGREGEEREKLLVGRTGESRVAKCDVKAQEKNEQEQEVCTDVDLVGSITGAGGLERSTQQALQ